MRRAWKLYLAGPINGCTDGEAHTWRELVKQTVGERNCIDPMIRDFRGVEGDHTAEIVEGDKADIQRSDIVLANCWQISAGTSMEILHAWSWNIPVIAMLPPDARVSPWYSYHSTVVHSLDEAYAEIRKTGRWDG